MIPDVTTFDSRYSCFAHPMFIGNTIPMVKMKLSLLLTCKLIHAEASTVLFSRALFCFAGSPGNELFYDHRVPPLLTPNLIERLSNIEILLDFSGKRYAFNPSSFSTKSRILRSRIMKPFLGNIVTLHSCCIKLCGLEPQAWTWIQKYFIRQITLMTGFKRITIELECEYRAQQIGETMLALQVYDYSSIGSGSDSSSNSSFEESELRRGDRSERVDAVTDDTSSKDDTSSMDYFDKALSEIGPEKRAINQKRGLEVYNALQTALEPKLGPVIQTGTVSWFRDLETGLFLEFAPYQFWCKQMEEKAKVKKVKDKATREKKKQEKLALKAIEDANSASKQEQTSIPEAKEGGPVASKRKDKGKRNPK